MDSIGYRISDSYLEIGRLTDKSRAGELECLIDSFWCYDPCGLEIPIAALPAERNGRITFGSLNNFCKINEVALGLWARVLRELGDSRLILLSRAGSHRQRALEILRAEGVESGRVEFVEPGERREYLATYQRIDIGLDPMPYNGHTTSLDALWMGVPVVSLAGSQSVSRAGLSQSANLGLEELVAFSPDDFVAITLRLARDLPRLTGLRRSLRPRMEASPLMDGRRFARSIENTYRSVWRRWCATRRG
jgi:predicted O-linked N-acetylglucosamine transferase (SPINDLY family)